MDKAIQLVVVAMIAIIAALLLAFLLQDQTGSFTEFLNIQSEDAKCSTAQTKVKNGLMSRDEFMQKKSKGKLGETCEIPPENPQSSSGNSKG